MSFIDAELVQRIHNDFLDSYDEELELEIEDRIYFQDAHMDSPTQSQEDKEYRQLYFRELFRLQGESEAARLGGAYRSQSCGDI